MSLEERFGVGFRWVVGGGFPVENEGKGGEENGEGTGKGTGKSMRESLAFPRWSRKLSHYECRQLLACLTISRILAKAKAVYPLRFVLPSH